MLVDVIMNVTLVPIWGFWGAGIACLMTYLARSIIALFLSLKKNKEIRYNYFAMYAVPLVFFALTFVNWLFVDYALVISFTIKIGLCFLLGLAFFFLYREQIQMLLKAKVKKYE